MKRYLEWLGNLKMVWEDKDLVLLDEILNKHVEYYENPNKEPLIQKKDIIKQWKIDLKDQENISFDFNILISDEKFCIANWNASFEISEEEFSYDGIFQISLDENGKCKYFKQWYVRK
jgi:hypothetical protein